MMTYPYPASRTSRRLVPPSFRNVAFAIVMVLASLAAVQQPSVATAQGTPVATPNADSTSITILTWECVPGTLTGQQLSYYQGEDQCEGEKLDVVFDVTDDTGTQQTTSVENGRIIDDLVGQVTITQILPAAYETPAIFCTPGAGQPGQHIAGSGDSVRLPSEVDKDYQCSFYNIPAGVSATGTGDVLVYTYTCTASPPPNSTYAWYFQNCTTRHNGATFVLDTPDADIESKAGDSIDGAVSMRGLTVGNYPLAEIVIPPNHEVGAVFCAEISKTELPGPAQMLPQQLRGNTITTPVTANMLVYCSWYHVPIVSGDGLPPVPHGFGLTYRTVITNPR